MNRKATDDDLNQVLMLLVATAKIDVESPVHLERLVKLAQTGEIRDVDFEDSRFTSALRDLLFQVWSLCGPEDDPFTERIHSLIGKIVELPEFTPTVAVQVCTSELAEAAVHRAIARQSRDEEQILGLIIYKSYLYSPSKVRAVLRPILAKPLQVVKEGEANCRKAASQIALVLRVLGVIIQGFQIPLSGSDKTLLLHFVMPLHHVPGKVSQEKPLLAIFHEPLVFCITQFLEKEPELAFPILKEILSAWPTSWAGNTPKEVLLLHELETVVEAAASVSNYSEVLSKGPISEAFIERISMSLGSAHSVVCERALSLWKNPNVAALFLSIAEPFLAQAAQPLVTRSAKHWNATVVRMTGQVLNQFRSTCPKLLFQSCSSFIDAVELNALIDAIQPLQRAEESDHDTDDEVETSGLKVPPKEDVTFMNMVQVKVLGEGSFGKVLSALKVVKGKGRSDWPEFALKQIDLEYAELAVREAELMDMVRHPNCTRLIATYYTKKAVNLVLEFAAKGDLHAVLATIGSLNEDSSRFIAAEVASGLAAVHDAGLVFGDLKPENILVHSNNHVKLGDFGSARRVEDCGPGARMEGTMVYLAPEIIQGKSNGQSVDWWAFGCVLYQMLAGCPPIWAEEEDDILEHIVQFDLEQFPEHFPSDAAGLVSKLLIRDPSKRLGTIPGKVGSAGARVVEQHEYFSTRGMLFDQVYKLPAPEMVPGKVKVLLKAAGGGNHSQQLPGGRWTQRTYSMIYSPLPSKYKYSGDSYVLAPIQEGDEHSAAWHPNQAGGKDASNSARKKYVPLLTKVSEFSAEGKWKLPRPGGSGKRNSKTESKGSKVLGPEGFGPSRTHMKRSGNTTSNISVNRMPTFAPRRFASEDSNMPSASNGYKFKGLNLTAG